MITRTMPFEALQSALREIVGLRSNDVTQAIGRILRAGWVQPRRQRQPYMLTEAGRAALTEPS